MPTTGEERKNITRIVAHTRNMKTVMQRHHFTEVGGTTIITVTVVVTIVMTGTMMSLAHLKDMNMTITITNLAQTTS